MKRKPQFRFHLNLFGKYLITVTCIFYLALFVALLPGCSDSLENPQDAMEKQRPLSDADTRAKKKVLLVHSYHRDYEWTHGINKGALETFGAQIVGDTVNDAKSPVTIKIVYMDTKHNKSEAFIKKAALGAKGVIDSWEPDVVITSDDNAARYLIAPYFKNNSLPFVFCGVNWDAQEYGFPCSNVTGMIEVQLMDQILTTLKAYAKGERIAFLKGDDDSARKEAAFFERRFHIELEKRFVKNFSEWKDQYQDLQNQSDMILMGNNASIQGWKKEEALEFVYKNTTIPTGNWDAWMAPYCLVTFANKPREQGEWSARTALRILDGEKPVDIPIAANQKAEIYLNMFLAKKMKIQFPMALIEQSLFVGQGEMD